MISVGASNGKKNNVQILMVTKKVMAKSKWIVIQGLRKQSTKPKQMEP